MQDTKKVQTLINAAAVAIEEARKLETIRTKYTAASPSVTGTPLQGKLTTLNKFLNDLNTLLNSEAANLLVDNKVKSHRGKAL